jgi:hypothetical protein
VQYDYYFNMYIQANIFFFFFFYFANNNVNEIFIYFLKYKIHILIHCVALYRLKGKEILKIVMIFSKFL